jgi:hypothetical protein
MSDRECPCLTLRSGTYRARASSSRTSGVLGGWPLSQLTEVWVIADAGCRQGSLLYRARTVQGMARVQSGQARAWPLVSDRSVRRGSRVKRDFACAFTSHFYPCSLSGGHSHA